MKKRILSLFLVVIMVVSILPVTAFAAGPDFSGWTVLAAEGGALSNGNYYLDADVTLTSNLVIEGNDVVLDLNGHVLKGNGSGCVINITSSGDVVKKLTLKDSAPTAVHTGDFELLPSGGIITGGKEAYGGGVCISNGKASFVMEGGTITGNEATYNGGGVSVGNLNATFTMLGGTISGNTANGNGGGVSVLNGNAIFTMNGGAIINNNAQCGAGVYVNNNNASLVMNGGSISENTSNSGGGGVFVNASATASVMNGGTIAHNNGGAYGGGININAGGSFIMASGTITDNYSTNGGGVCAINVNAKFIMTGGSVNGNSAQNGGGMCVMNETASIIMTGGSVSGNTASQNGGGVHFAANGSETVFLGGTAKITDNVVGGTLSGGTVSGGTNNNLYICEGKSVTLGEGIGDATNGVDVPVTGENGMSIGVTYGGTKGIGTFISNTATDEEMKCFIPDEAGKYIVRNSDNKLEFVTPWSALQTALSAETLTISNSIPNIFDVTIDNAVPNIKLLQAITADIGDTTLSVTGTKILDLNGKVIDGKISDSASVGSVIFIGSGGALTLKDSAPTASHTGNYASLPAGGIITGGSAESGGGVSNSGTFIMTNGTITGNSATQSGGGVYATPDSVNILTGGTISGNTAANGGGLYLREEMCFVAGTPITMADGTRKPIETLEIGDLVRVFDHDTGMISTAKLFDVGAYPEKHSGVVKLHFSHDIDVTVVYGHSFFEREANKYVTVSRDNVESFVGHEFYNVDDACWETLIGYELVDGAVDTYIITSEKHLNSVANGMLNNEDGFYTMLTNIFEFGDGLKTDAEKKAKDIEKCGLWSFDNAKYISRNTYDVLNLQYLNVAFGKGMITPEKVDYLEAFWTAIYPEGFCDPEEPEENELDICLMLLGDEPLAPTLPTDAGLYVGGTLKITENSSGNLYLPSSKQITIGTGTSTGGNGVAALTAGFTVGVSTASEPTAATPVAITANGTATDAAYFTSDNSAYEIRYSNDSGHLELYVPSSYTVTFAMNGHGTQVAPQTVTAGAIAECPANPSASGWTFGGWYANEGLTTQYVFAAPVTANTTIYAKWTQNAPTPDDPEPYYPPIIPETIPEPAKETTENYAVPVESEENSVQVKAKIEGGTATVGEITEDMLNGIVGKKTSGGGDADVEKAGAGRASVSIDLSGANLTVTGAELTKKSVENLANITKDENNDVDSVVINMSEASVELDAKTLETLQESMAGDTLKLVVDSIDVESLNKKQLDTLAKYNPGLTLEAYFESRGKKIHDFNGGTAKVSVEFTPEIGKSANNYKACYLDENGILQKHTTKYENGMLTFITGHFSEYAIIYDGVKDVLLAEAETTKKGYIKLSWNETEGAVKYVVYGAKCGKSYKKLTETESNSFTAKKISGAKPVVGKTYKLYVVAYDALGNAIKSKAIHYIAGDISGKYANVETITALTKSLELTVDEKAVADAGYTMYGDKKHTPKSHGKALRFTSNCPEVVKVLRDGTITAMKAGTATIYIQDISGKWCTMEVTVKEK